MHSFGAIYLVGLGLAMLLRGRKDAPAPAAPSSRVYLESLTANVFNPKAASFYLTLPAQFATIDVAGPCSGSPPPTP